MIIFQTTKCTGEPGAFLFTSQCLLSPSVQFGQFERKE